MTDVLKLGKRIFTVGVVVTTILWSLGVAALVPAVANAATCPTFNAGDMIKVSGHAAIYTVNNAGKVLYFPSGDEFKSWNVDNTYGGYTTITQACYDAMPVPSVFPVGVNYRPGSYVIKRPSSDQLYVVEPNNTIAKISTTDAAALYGASYKVMTVADVFWPNYIHMGSDIAGKAHDGMLVSNAGSTWYVDGNVLRMVTASGMTANRWKAAWVHAVPASYLSGLSTGATIDALVSSLANRAQDGTVVTPVGGAVTVTLAADTPASMTLPMKATGVTYLKFNVTAGANAVTLSTLTLHRIGVGSYNDLSNVYVYDGANRLTSGRTLTSDTNQAVFSNLNVALTAGQTKTLSVLADLNPALTNNGAVDGFEVVNANGSVVSGVSGNLMSIGNASASTVTVDNSGGGGTFALGSTQVEVARGTINAGSALNDVKVTRLTLTNAGSLSNSYLANLNLTIGSSPVATAATMTDDKVVFNLPTAYTITKGDQKTFYVYADNTGGRVNDNVQFYVDETTDLGIIDTQYSVGAYVANSWAASDQTYTVTGGDLTLAANGPASGNIGTNLNNVVLQNFSFSAGNAVTVKSTKVWLMVTDANGVATNTAAYYNYFKNVKIVDLDNGNSTIVGPDSAIGTDGTVSGNSYFKVFTDSYSLAAGTTRHFAVMADVDQSTLSGVKIQTKVDYSVASTVKYDNNSQYVDASNIVPNTLTGNVMTVNAANLSVGKVTPPPSASVVPGVTQNTLGVLLTAGSAADVKIDSMILRVFASSSAITGDNGNLAANTAVNTVALYEDGASAPLATKNLSSLSGTIGANGYYYVQYTGLNYVVPAGTSKKLVAVLGLKNTISGTTYVSVDMVPSADITMETAADGKTVILNSPGAGVAINATTPVQLTISAAGTFTASVDGTTPTADIVISGSASPVSMATYALTATNENFTVTGARLVAKSMATANPYRDISQVTLTYKNKTGNTETKTCYLDTNSQCVFSDGQLDIYVPHDVSTLVTVGAYYNTIGNGAFSGDDVKLGFAKASSTLQFGASGNLTNDFIVLGESSNTKLYGNLNNLTMTDAAVAAQVVHKTDVAVAQGDTGSVIHSTRSQDAVGVFTFTSAAEPASSQNSTLSSMTMQFSGNLIVNTGSHSATVYVYNGSTFDSNHLMGSATVTGLATGTSNAVTVGLLNQNQWTGAKTVYVVMDTTGNNFLDTSQNTEKLTTQLTTYAWLDGATNPGGAPSINPVTGVPTYGLTYSY